MKHLSSATSPIFYGCRTFVRMPHVSLQRTGALSPVALSGVAPINYLTR
jgi:hypothetical protein